jgi:hypothetical protein
VPNRAQNFDSNGPEGRIRGNATQVYEKYSGLARDAEAAGDRVLMQAFLQFAEHYFRVMNDSTDPEPLRAQFDRREPAAVQPTEGGEVPEGEGDEAGEENGLESRDQRPDPRGQRARNGNGHHRGPRGQRERLEQPRESEEAAYNHHPAEHRRHREDAGELAGKEGQSQADASGSEASGSEDEGLRKMLADRPRRGRPPRRVPINGAGEEPVEDSSRGNGPDMTEGGAERPARPRVHQRTRKTKASVEVDDEGLDQV